MAGGREIEFKFLATPDELATIINAGALAPLRNAPAPLQISTYFDTPERTLQAAGFILRLRETADGRRIQTVKQDGAGLSRGEWEWDIGGDTPDFALAAQTPLGAILDHDLCARTTAIFTTRVNRRKADIVFTVAKVEVALDEGEIIAGTDRAPIVEVEFELKSGRRRGLFALVRKMSRKTPLQLSLISKGERGFRIAAGLWGHPVKMLSPRLDPDMDVRDAFSAIVYNCLRQIMLNAPAFESGHVVEAVHQSRVAVRRLRAAFTLFRPICEDSRFAAIAKDLKWISDLLGQARDIDVLLTETVDPALASGERIPGLTELAGIIGQRQGNAHGELLRGLHSVRYRRLITELLLWIEDGPWRHGRLKPAEQAEADPVPANDPEAQGDLETLTGSARAPAGGETEKLKDFLARRLRSGRRKLARVSVDMGSLPEEELHQVRIRAKKLRYQAAFFASLANGPKSAKRFARFLDALEEVQETLGSVHDSEATAALLESEASSAARKGGQHDPLILFAAGRLAGAHPNRKKLVDRAVEALRTAVETKPFWKKL